MKKFQLLLTAVIAVALMAGCGGSGKEKAKTTEKAETITGAGATFPQPFYNKIFKNYSSEKGLLGYLWWNRIRRRNSQSER